MEFEKSLDFNNSGNQVYSFFSKIKYFLVYSSLGFFIAGFNGLIIFSVVGVYLDIKNYFMYINYQKISFDCSYIHALKVQNKFDFSFKFFTFISVMSCIYYMSISFLDSPSIFKEGISTWYSIADPFLKNISENIIAYENYSKALSLNNSLGLIEKIHHMHAVSWLGVFLVFPFFFANFYYFKDSYKFKIIEVDWYFKKANLQMQIVRFCVNLLIVVFLFIVAFLGIIPSYHNFSGLGGFLFFVAPLIFALFSMYLILHLAFFINLLSKKFKHLLVKGNLL